jgi:Lon protease-like protein
VVDLPLFPLNTVLFPGGTLPLHIFEERYKLMMSECIQQNAPFGVVLIKSGQEVGGPAEPHAIGTLARISRVQELDDGRLNIVAVGVERFRILTVLQSYPYMRADVELLGEDNGPDDRPENLEVAEEVSRLYVDYYRLALALTSQWQDRVGVPERPHALADFVATRIDTESELKQRLLEMPSVSERLNTERDLLKQAVGVLTEQVAASRRNRYGGLGALN